MSDRFHHLLITPADFEASLTFYRDKLGWSILESWGGKGHGRGVLLSGGGMKVLLAEKNAPGAADQGLGSTRPNVHLDIHDIDARFGLLGQGPHVVRAPEDTPWGTRWFVVRDPDGNLIAFEELHGG